jgi:hypothetical protein
MLWYKINYTWTAAHTNTTQTVNLSPQSASRLPSLWRSGLSPQPHMPLDWLRNLSHLAPTRPSKGSCTLNLEDEDVLYSLQQRPLNSPLNLENAAGSSICRVSLNGSLSI